MDSSSDTLVGVDLSVHFGGVFAVDKVSVELTRGTILGLIGPNGAGKTTLTNVLTGFQRPSTGQVLLAGAPVSHLKAFQLVRQGVARTFQDIRVFPRLSVLQNAVVAGLGCGMTQRDARTLAEQILERFNLATLCNALASSLTSVDARKLGVVRALATKPRFLLLDEPAAGMNEAETQDVLGSIRAVVADFGCGLLTIEHNIQLIMALCDRIQVLDHGRTIAVGTPSEIRSNPLVLRAYLGTR